MQPAPTVTVISDSPQTIDSLQPIPGVSFARNALGIDYLSLVADYARVTHSFTQGNIKTEVGGIAITAFTDCGIVGTNDAGKQLYKDLLELQFTVRTYTAYSQSQFYTRNTGGNSLFLVVYKTNLVGAVTSQNEYTYNMPRYDLKTSRPANGAQVEIPLTASFSVPLAGDEIGGYRIDDVNVYTLSMTTASAATIQSISTTSYTIDPTMNVFSPDMSAATYATQSVASENGIGTITTDTAKRVDDFTYLKSGMSTNARLGSSENSYVSGTYSAAIGCSVYAYERNVDVKFGKIRVNAFNTISLTMSETRREKQRVAPGVENYAISQNIKVAVEIYSVIEKTEAILSAPQMDLPVQNETVVLQDPEIYTPHIYDSALVLRIGGYVTLALIGLVIVGFLLLKSGALQSVQLARIARSTKRLERNTRKKNARYSF